MTVAELQEGGCVQGCPVRIASSAALSPIGTRLDSIAEVLPDAASACDIVNSRGGACMGSLYTGASASWMHTRFLYLSN